MGKLFAGLRRRFSLGATAAALLLGMPLTDVMAQPKPAEDKGLAGLGLGLGIATSFDVGGRRVGTADIVSGIVRINDSSANVGVGFVLEAHYFFRDWYWRNDSGGFISREACKKFAGSDYLGCTQMATGPFVAIEIGGGNSATPKGDGPITAYALGWMVGFRHPDAPKASSWNFGVGLRVDPRAQRLGDGFVANQAPPAGETAIRYRTEPRYGVMLLSTFSF